MLREHGDRAATLTDDPIRRDTRPAVGRVALPEVVRSDLPLTALRRAGYSAKAAESVVGAMVQYPDTRWSLRLLAAGAGVSRPTAAAVCRDLVEVGHVAVERKPLHGGASRAHQHWLTTTGLAHWGGPGLVHGVLPGVGREPDREYAFVMGARPSRAEGDRVGYSFAVLVRLARVLIRMPPREWSLSQLRQELTVGPGTLRLACADLEAAGYLTGCYFPDGQGGERAEPSFLITMDGLMAWLEWFSE